MISVMGSLHHRPLDQVDKCLDSQLWHACAGGMVQMPPVNSKVFYFPQGHCEQALGRVDFGSFSSVPAMVLCRVSAVVFMADSETDEVYAKLRLVPVMGNECEFEDDNGVLGICKSEDQEKPSSFAKTLTQSDANNGGGFSVPRYCAETIFPRLDYSAEPPVQTILAKDVHGQVWKFRHIYRGTPRRHLLTTGWSNFVNQKKLVAGDSIVFLRADNGDLCVGIRRAKRGFGGGTELTSGWNTVAGNCGPVYGGFSGFTREDENKYGRNGDKVNGCFSGHLNGVGKVSVKSVYEAAIAAAYGQPFEIVYYPRASTPEFCVKSSSVRAAMTTQWYSGMRFKMAFETEDSSRISWFMGTISSVQVEDPIRWPNSMWRLLQVAWDEPDLHQNVKRVNPWLVELVSNMPAIHLSPFSPPRKKLRVPHPPDFPHMGQLSMPSLPSNSLSPSNPYGCISDNIPAGIQGARHAQYGLPTPDLHFSKLQLSLFPFGFQQLNHTAAPPSRISSNGLDDNPKIEDNVSCLLTMGNSSPSLKKTNGTKTPTFLLFGQPILTEQQLSHSSSGDTSRSSSLDGNSEKLPNLSDGSGSAILQNGPPDSSSDEGYESKENGHCKVLMESDNVGRTLDLFSLGSYEDLYGKLAMFANARCETSPPAINF